MPPAPYTRTMEATAYSSDWRSCGWTWGLSLGPLPFYVPLCLGTRPSGTREWPLVPRPRRDVADAKADLALGGLALACLTALSVASGALLDGSFLRRRAAIAARGRVARAAALGAGVGATAFPIGRYWAETDLAGLPYSGATASGKQPRAMRPPITRVNPLTDPIAFASRVLTLQWGPVDGSIAADTSVYPFGTRMKIEGMGWGVVDDRGGGVVGGDRIDIYVRRRKRALEFGRKRVEVTVHQPPAGR